jgi:hypothetical protein
MQYRSAAKAPFNLLKVQILLGSSLKATTSSDTLVPAAKLPVTNGGRKKWEKMTKRYGN